CHAIRGRREGYRPTDAVRTDLFARAGWQLRSGQGWIYGALRPTQADQAPLGDCSCRLYLPRIKTFDTPWVSNQQPEETPCSRSIISTTPALNGFSGCGKASTQPMK